MIPDTQNRHIGAECHDCRAAVVTFSETDRRVRTDAAKSPEPLSA